MISPLASAKVRKSNIRSTKNDKRDCKTIARAYFEKDFPLHKKSDEIYDNLREMNRYYHYLTEQSLIVVVTKIKMMMNFMT